MFMLESGCRRKTGANFMEPVGYQEDWQKRSDLEYFISCLQEEERTVQGRLDSQIYEPGHLPPGSVTCHSGRFVMRDEQWGLTQELRFSHPQAAVLFLRTLRASGLPSTETAIPQAVPV